MSKDSIVQKFAQFSYGQGPGLGEWLSEGIHPIVSERLDQLPSAPLTKVQFNQLLVVSQVASVSDGFFKYYWRQRPQHPYNVESVDGFSKEWFVQEDQQVIYNLEHLAWGLSRLYIDGLLFFGNVKAAFNFLRSMTIEQLAAYFKAKRFDTTAISDRGPALPLSEIPKEERYLISEMACKTFGDGSIPESKDAALKLLQEAWEKHAKSGGGTIGFKELVKKYASNASNSDQLELSYSDLGEQSIDSWEAIKVGFEKTLDKFLAARKKAMGNTEFYLSMVNDLDVYVATSMRNRQNFRDMADACTSIFNDARLKDLHLRYFDPTLSAARGHEDKGLIECLMVKCAKVLVYCEGEKESYGKDAEAAMALSLGKPVIFYCDQGKKTNFYRDVHPLARLIDFRSGVAVGAIVSDKVGEVAELLSRIFNNKMEYRIEQHPARKRFLKLADKLTNSVVRLQTDDELITRTFWNNYNNRSQRPVPTLATGKEAERLLE